MSVLVRGARTLTLARGPVPRRGLSMRDLGVIERGDVLVEGGRVAAVGGEGTLEAPAGSRVIEARGRVLMPGFVDAHTHLCWAGDRLEEWAMRLRGASYLDILKAGGGIMSTVRAVRAASEAELLEALLVRLRSALREGTTTVEVKSGYGLTAEHELKMLRAIAAAARLAERDPGLPTVVPTALLGHAIDRERPGFVRETVEGTLDAVHEVFPGITVDVFCEEGAWSLEESVALLERAMALGHPVRAHADQFHALGLVEWMASAAEAGRPARSVDHLEATGPEGLERVARSPLFGVALPCAGFHTDGRYMRARGLVDAGGGGAVVVATNANPGSAPCWSMPMAVSLAVRGAGLTPEEAIAGCTVNAAALLGLGDRGAVSPGRRADLILLRHEDERGLACAFGGDPVDVVIRGGSVVWEKG